MLGEDAQRHAARDARRCKRSLSYLQLRRIAALSPDPLLHERFMQCDRKVRRIGRPTRLVVGCFLILLGVAVGALFVGIAVSGSHRSVGFPIQGPIAGVAMFLLLGVGVLRGAFGYNPAKVIRVMTAQGICPSCLAFLDGAPVQSDGCVECPDCGAAWRAPVITSAPAP